MKFRSLALALLASTALVGVANAQSLVNKNTPTTGSGALSTSVATTLPSLTVGNALIVDVGYCGTGASCIDSVGTPTVTVSDTAGNAFTLRLTKDGTQNFGQKLFTAPIAHAGTGTDTITASFAGNARDYPTIKVQQVNGLDPTIAIDVSGSTYTAASDPMSVPLTTTVANDYIYAAIDTFQFTGEGASQTLENAPPGTPGWGDTIQTGAAAGSHAQSFSGMAGAGAGWSAVEIAAAFKPVSTRIISSQALSKLTFTPNSSAATVGTDTVTMNPTSPSFATDGGTLAVNNNNPNCNFAFTGTTLKVGAVTTCGPGNYTIGMVATDTNSQVNNSPLTTMASLEAQVVAGMTQFTASNTFTANLTNAEVGVVTATMNPSTPAWAGTWSITGANSCGFHIVNGNHVQAGTGTNCTTTSGPHANGTFDDWNLHFVPTNSDIPTPADQAETAVAIAPPSDFPVAISWQNTAPVTGQVVFRSDRAMTIKNIFGNVVVPEGAGARVNINKNGCGGGSTQLNSTSFSADQAAGSDQSLGVAVSALAQNDLVVLCPSGFPSVPVGAAGITLSVQE